MKNQAVVFLVSFLLIAALLPKSDSFGGPVPGRKRELQGKFKRVASKVCLVARTLGCGAMEQNAYDDATEQQRKPAEY